jgi:hypothetical protein
VKRRTAVVAGTLAFLGAAILIPVLASGEGDRARIRITGTEPVTVAGDRFERGELLRVRVASGETTRERRVRAGARGTFVARFDDVLVDRCNSGVVVRAVGSRGSRVAAMLARVACPVSL